MRYYPKAKSELRTFIFLLKNKRYALIDRTVARWTEIRDKEFYYIMTAADGDLSAMETTLACFRGYADCVEGAKEMGVIYGTGVYEKGEILDSEQMKQAYEMGKSI